MRAATTESESLAEFRARREREAAGPRGPVSFYWGDMVTRPDQRVEGAPGLWSPLPVGEAGLRVRAAAAEGLTIGDELVDGEAVLPYGEVAHFAGGGEGVIFTYDHSRYALQVWNQHSEWAESFAGISAFPEDPSWVVDAEVTPIAPGRTVSISHYRDPAPVEVPVVAEVEFTRGTDTVHAVATAAGPYAGRLVLHFRDITNGTESYGAGRSLWFSADALERGHAVLDFNRVQLLPCAFSKAWNCPLPPAENRFTIAVRAGERNAVDADGTPLL